MATEKQINANRLNATKSRGPRTAAGKAIASLNALKTGEYAKTEAALSAADLRNLTADYMAEYSPMLVEERFFVDVLIHSTWQSRRYRRLETAIWKSHIIPGAPEAENSLGALYVRAARELDYVGRLEESADKRFYSALKWLRQLRSARASQAKAAAAMRPSRLPASGLFSVPKRS
jgi:hypothetical protein